MDLSSRWLNKLKTRKQLDQNIKYDCKSYCLRGISQILGWV
ncbi:Uncharacterized protein BN1224_CV14_A_04630 [Chlamydia pneumoniae]|uniref:Uncharacterized protein n=1 Tax=Chlamydia pneumoniae TaxID=83558 RepID=Q9K298_CHLPN|nr:hypothetical protein CP_0304 [Chlamydia pneumoniae AR39]CRI32953.1 Uncharacterized protein BN1224_Wien1_A_04600 [Chlamydia pneumoniae]CRI35816.1 Uncharacterized protein BN1224_CM1_A_04630 [Chlamydia pneumoniae]CRI36944.1 Uncharacterized protein BN1224_CV14_A_04630 [Chlamydia pneumoniae]CRI38067.1 Uncharacterized protein BN1224_CV15_B_03900 [Chlamydia pneumoniae]